MTAFRETPIVTEVPTSNIDIIERMVEPGGIEPPTSCMPFIGDINDFNGLVGIVELDCLTFILFTVRVDF